MDYIITIVEGRAKAAAGAWFLTAPAAAFSATDQGMSREETCNVTRLLSGTVFYAPTNYDILEIHFIRYSKVSKKPIPSLLSKPTTTT